MGEVRVDEVMLEGWEGGEGSGAEVPAVKEMGQTSSLEGLWQGGQEGKTYRHG